jgi:hypothetical protein
MDFTFCSLNLMTLPSAHQNTFSNLSQIFQLNENGLVIPNVYKGKAYGCFQLAGCKKIWE